jgi:hypothetical protein
MRIPGSPRDGALILEDELGCRPVDGHATPWYGLCFGKSAGNPPAPPDPVATANAQQTSNTGTAIAQSQLNNVNQITPYGNLTYTSTPGVGVSGQTIPQWTATQTLTPAEQDALDKQQTLTSSLYGLANDQTGRINDAVSQPFDMSKVPALPTDPGQINQQASDAVYNQAASRLDPQWQQAGQQEADTLAHQGIAPGSDAYETEMANFNRAKNDAYNSAQNTATVTGANIGAQNFGEATSANQNAIQEQNFLREQPLNEAIALMGGGQIQNPSFSSTPQTAVSPTDVTGAFGLASNAANQAYQAKSAAASSGNAAGAGLLAAAGTAAAIF